MTDLLKLLKDATYSELSEIIKEESLCSIIKLLDDKKISRTVAKELFDKTIETKENPMDIAKKANLLQGISNETIFGIVDAVLAEKPELADQYKAEPDKITNFIVGQVMRQTQGKANGGLVKEYVAKKLG